MEFSRTKVKTVEHLALVILESHHLKACLNILGEDCRQLWSEAHGRQVFAKTMSYTRFCEIKRMIRFDNENDREYRLIEDKLAPIREVLNHFVGNAQRAYRPSDQLTVDEQLFPYKGRCRFIQYMPSKPDKYGLKFFLLSDVANSYIYNLRMYTGKCYSTTRLRILLYFPRFLILSLDNRQSRS